MQKNLSQVYLQNYFLSFEPSLPTEQTVDCAAFMVFKLDCNAAVTESQRCEAKSLIKYLGKLSLSIIWSTKSFHHETQTLFQHYTI